MDDIKVNWEELAIYLMDCHAATVESMPKSWSKREKARMVLISERIMRTLDTGLNPNTYSTPVTGEEKLAHVKERVANGIEISKNSR
jgi:hypothetical protein